MRKYCEYKKKVHKVPCDNNKPTNNIFTSWNNENQSIYWWSDKKGFYDNNTIKVYFSISDRKLTAYVMS